MKRKVGLSNVARRHWALTLCKRNHSPGASSKVPLFWTAFQLALPKGTAMDSYSGLLQFLTSLWPFLYPQGVKGICIQPCIPQDWELSPQQRLPSHWAEGGSRESLLCVNSWDWRSQKLPLRSRLASPDPEDCPCSWFHEDALGNSLLEAAAGIKHTVYHIWEILDLTPHLPGGAADSNKQESFCSPRLTISGRGSPGRGKPGQKATEAESTIVSSASQPGDETGAGEKSSKRGAWLWKAAPGLLILPTLRPFFSFSSSVLCSF